MSVRPKELFLSVGAGLFFLLAGCDRAGDERSGRAAPRVMEGIASAPSTKESGEADRAAMLAVVNSKGSLKAEIKWWLADVQMPGGGVRVRKEIEVTARTRADELADSLNSIRDFQLKGIIISVLSERPGQIGVIEGMALLRKLQPHLRDLRSTVEGCIKQWTKGMDSRSALTQLAEFRRLAPELDSEYNSLATYAMVAGHRDPAGFCKLIAIDVDAVPGQRGPALEAVANWAMEKDLGELQEELVRQGGLDIVSAGPALTTVARRISAKDLDGYARYVETQRDHPAVYDHLVFGYIQRIVNEDIEAAGVWAETITDVSLRKSARMMLATSGR